MNLLYYGDNLEVLRRHIKDESVDLVYLDPPFKSDQNYNVLFASKDGKQAAAQIQAFEDTWQWDAAAAAQYEEMVEQGGKVSEVLRAFRLFLGTNDMLAYLSMMAPRLVELHRALKPTGSLYLHCDPTASHYLKLLLDAVFGPANFRNEIIWKRSSSHADTKQGMKRCGRIHDVILLFSKSSQYTWNPVYTEYDEHYIESLYRFVDEDGRRYREGDLTAAKPGGDVSYAWRVKRRAKTEERWVPDLDDEWKRPRAGWDYLDVRPYKGRYWAYSKDNMVKMWKAGQMIHRSTGFPQFKRYLEEQPGVPLQDLWTDINPLSGSEKERLGYPTQKPEALLERMVASSSNPGDVVLDPFCGCGTTVSVAERLGRRWIGIDVTHLAIALIKARLLSAFGQAAKYRVVGEPTTVDDARELAESDPYQFQWWALGLVGARGVERKGADRGVDGRLFWHEGDAKTRQLVISVKAGKVTRSQVHELRGVVGREEAEIGVLLSFEHPTKPMREEAASAGFYTSPWGKHPRIQLLTVGEILEGKGIDYPRTAGSNVTVRQAPKAKRGSAQQLEIGEDGDEPESRRPGASKRKSSR